MSLTTHSKFYYGFIVDTDNNQIDFDEGGAELTAELAVGEYTMTDYAAEVERALNAAGADTYTVAVSRSTRILTIATDGVELNLLTTTGSHAGTSAYSDMGFSGADKTGALTYSGSAAIGTSYATQFILQDYVPSDHFQKAIDPSVNVSASGIVEVIKFGTQEFIEMNFKYITDQSMPSGGPIRNSATGLADFLSFMQHMATKAPFEFMPDEDDVATFQEVILESTPEDKNGVGYKLKELYGQGLPGFYESGVLRMRVI